MQGFRRPTMQDVATAAGVSRALVSIVFRDAPGASDDTRRHVRDAAREIGYAPDQRAQLLGRKRTGILGVSFSLAGDFHALLVEHVYAAAESAGYGVVLSGFGPRRTEAAAQASLSAFRCEGVVLIGSGLALSALRAAAMESPVVVVLRPVRDREIGVVRTDDLLGARLATEHLLGLGHHRLVHVDGGRAPGAADRRAGVRRAALAAGATCATLTGGITEEDGLRAGAELVRRLGVQDAPTGAAVFNDDCAVGVIAAVRRAGFRVPEDLSVVGFDDSRLAGMPGVDLTTIRQDAPALAEQAVQQVLRRAGAADEPAARTVIRPALVERRTTAPPR